MEKWEDKIINMDMDNPGQPAKDWFTGTELAFIEKVRQEAREEGVAETIEFYEYCEIIHQTSAVKNVMTILITE